MHTFSFQLWNVFIRRVCACVAGLRWVWQKESFLTASAPSRSVGILSRSLSLQCPHSSFSACFLELVPTPCPRTVAVTIVSLPDSNLAHSRTCLQPLTLRKLLFAHNWPVATHVPESQLIVVGFEHLSKSMCLFSSLIPTYQKWVKSCRTSGLGMNFLIL